SGGADSAEMRDHEYADEYPPLGLRHHKQRRRHETDGGKDGNEKANRVPGGRIVGIVEASGRAKNRYGSQERPRSRFVAAAKRCGAAGVAQALPCREGGQRHDKNPEYEQLSRSRQDLGKSKDADDEADRKGQGGQGEDAGDSQKNL